MSKHALSTIGFVLTFGARIASAQDYNLSSGWSNTVNPNGPWSYTEGASALPLVASWNGANTGWSSSCKQPAWAPSNTAGSFLPAWMQINSCAAPFFPMDPNNSGVGNVLPGDV